MDWLRGQVQPKDLLSSMLPDIDYVQGSTEGKIEDHRVNITLSYESDSRKRKIDHYSSYSKAED